MHLQVYPGVYASTNTCRLEAARAQTAYGVRTALNQVLVINLEITPGRITVVLVDEVLGF